jgi:hypothetical protein
LSRDPIGEDGFKLYVQKNGNFVPHGKTVNLLKDISKTTCSQKAKSTQMINNYININFKFETFYGFSSNNPIGLIDKLGLIVCYLPEIKDPACMTDCRFNYLVGLAVVTGIYGGSVISCNFNLTCQLIAAFVYGISVFGLDLIYSYCKARCGCIKPEPYYECHGCKIRGLL